MSFPILLLTCVVVTLYLLVVYAEKRILDFWVLRYDARRASLLAVLTEKYAGFVLLGLLPLAIALIFPGTIELRFFRQVENKNLIWIYALVFSAVAITVNYFRAGNPKNYAIYPKARLREWKPLNWIAYEMGWVNYLLAYEWLFRAFLFFPMAEEWGFWPATIVNIILYVLAHLPKGWLEMAGSVPFGLLLCWVAWSSGSFLAPWIIHCSLALSNSFFAIRANPEMKFVAG